MNRLFKNLYSKWLNHISATEEGDQQSDNLMKLLNTVGPRPLQSKITTHSLRYGSANFLDSNPGILTTCIAERGGWLLESINKVFNYTTGQSNTDKKVARALSEWPNVDERGICPNIFYVYLLQNMISSIVFVFTLSITLLRTELSFP